MPCDNKLFNVNQQITYEHATCIRTLFIEIAGCAKRQLEFKNKSLKTWHLIQNS